jgi:predicted metalloprotease with PDZ domain
MIYDKPGMSQVSTRIAFSLLALVAAASTSAAAPSAIMLEVDATDVTHGIEHVHLGIPVRPGPLTLAYPKWIPGEHAATGPLTQLVSLQFLASGRTLPWRRDSLDAFSFHIDIPRGVERLEVRFDYISPPQPFGDAYGKTPSITPHLLILPFNQVVLYPQDASAEAVEVKADVLLPAGWKFDDALGPQSVEGGHVSLPQVSLYTLIDSPLLAGEFFRTIPVTEGAGGTRVSIAADTAGDLAMSNMIIASMRRLVAEATGLFGPAHYRQYVWLVALGNTLDKDGLEHHESTDIRDNESLFTDPEHLVETRVLAHEYVHSWNGKYRRPIGLATRNYQQPMADDLLWVYEGMTRYLGDFVLSARSGLGSPELMRAYVASVAAHMDLDRPGRAWRSIADTATAMPEYNDAPKEWAGIRRERDFYNEMLLVWLEADTLIRQNTDNQRSLDDFCRVFYGGSAGVPSVKPYSRADLVKALHTIAPLDWDSFLGSRVDAINAHAPLAGIEMSGWKLTYDDTPNEFLSAHDVVVGMDDLTLSLGLLVKPDGTVVDVVNGSAAFAAGIAPAMRLLAVNGQQWTIKAVREAVTNAEKSPEPIELIVESGDTVRTLQVDFHAGLRNPHLVRNEERPDVLSQIMAPKSVEPR